MRTWTKIIWNKITKDYKEQLMYIICGVLTTIVNFVIFAVLMYYSLPLGISNTMAFIGSVLFAYRVNRKYVFISKKETNLKLNFQTVI